LAGDPAKLGDDGIGFPPIAGIRAKGEPLARRRLLCSLVFG
jgi:hypothetical protein